ncbi:ATP-binding protein [Rhizobacter sp. Root1221]|uniref:PAS domain-containing sensor histidine kinase n=1 Tax=Rhizobacter sp. Root1221 TaxID=1736433 RepID=UPI0006F6E377|nr:ATP-binding protein [Rhizobacter sp. Root1221]KQV95136.1 PAS domain-containing sensor histidine kinase [Rhizobacter sp. Root1221]
MPSSAELIRPRRWRRALLWAMLVSLLLVAQSLLVWLTLNFESNRAQEVVEGVAAAVVVDLKQALRRDQQNLQALLWNNPSSDEWRQDAATLLRTRRELLRVERRGEDMTVTGSVDSPFQQPVFSQIPRDDLDLEADLACAAAKRQAGPAYSRTYFVPMSGAMGQEVVDLCMPVVNEGRAEGFMVSTLSLPRLLDEVVPNEVMRGHEILFVEGDGTRLARAGVPRGAGVFKSERLVDLPGLTLQLRVDSSGGRPQLIPNLTTALVLGLSLALGAVVALLARDVRKRANAESALAESLAFRKAMEDSLVTGLRARDLQGRITYVNPAFCNMVGFPAAELIGQMVPSYWPPEKVTEYLERQAVRLSGTTAPPREGFETVFMHRDGARFPVMIYEAPLVDGTGTHTGWMSATLDLSAQRKVEEMSRQQQERLQATARLATVGEMASLLSHELNQPLAAIASYAAGSLNLMNDPAEDTPVLLRQAAQRIAEQAERAGRVIKSVHDFVRRREQAHEPVRADQLIDSVLPLVRLQARKSGARIEIDLPSPVPRVVCDRTMLEQVMLNLTRNGIQAMESDTPLERRELRIRVRQSHPRWVTFSIIDHGPGVNPDVASRLFTPFFTTRTEGMGLGLSLCRTVIEQHGGVLDFQNLQGQDGKPGGAEFRFTLVAEAPHGPSHAARARASDSSTR